MKEESEHPWNSVGRSPGEAISGLTLLVLNYNILRSGGKFSIRVCHDDLDHKCYRISGNVTKKGTKWLAIAKIKEVKV
jgi:hypothetical protein